MLAKTRSEILVSQMGIYSVYPPMTTPFIRNLFLSLAEAAGWLGVPIMNGITEIGMGSSDGEVDLK